MENLNPLTPDLTGEIARLVGRERAFTDRETLLTYSYDALGRKHLPEMAVFPKDAKTISEIMKLATAKRFAVSPRGAGSGFTGGSVPARGGLALCLSRMNRILSIDEENLTAEVEPGVVNGDLRKAVEARGLYYPPDPSSLAFSTLGGNVAECAGGPRAFKYGVTRDYVMDLEAVLPTGEIVRAGAATVKGVVGYDLTRLLVGSEGTLAVVTKIVLKLLPLPEERRTLLSLFPAMKEAITAVMEMVRAKVVPATLEFLDDRSIRCVADRGNLKYLEGAGGLLLIEVDGYKESIPRQAADVRRVCEAAGALEIREARNAEEAEDLWAARRAVSPSLSRIGPFKINEDIAVPRSRLLEALEGVVSICRRRELANANFGHAGDGNIHVNILLADRKDEKARARAEEAVREIFELTVSLGGTMSGEHGVGLAKAPYLDIEVPPALAALQERIKIAFDPAGILNPGKIFRFEG